MPDVIADNFGLLEAVLFLELTLLLTAIVFFYAAKIATKNNRHDPILRFWYVFWRAFSATVTPVRVYDSRIAEERARALGVVGIGELSPGQLAEMDAPDLGGISADEVVSHTIIDTPPPPATPRPSKSDATSATVVADGTLDARIVGRSDADAVLGRDGTTLVAGVRNEIEDGQANGVLVQLIAGALGVPVYRIVLLRGHYKAEKAFKIVGVDQAGIERRLRQLPTL
ncbi:MAG: DUF167 family protein [Tepidisphaeraceae bacterium]